MTDPSFEQVALTFGGSIIEDGVHLGVSVTLRCWVFLYTMRRAPDRYL